MKLMFVVFPSIDVKNADYNNYISIESNIFKYLSCFKDYDVKFMASIEDAIAMEYINKFKDDFDFDTFSISSSSDKRFLGLTHESTSSIDTSEFVKDSLNRFKPQKQSVVNDIIAYNGQRLSLANSRIVYAYKKLLDSSIAKYILFLTDSKGSSMIQPMNPVQGDGKLICRFNCITTATLLSYGGVPIYDKYLDVILGGR